MNINDPQRLVPIVDSEGRLTLEGITYILSLVQAVRDLQARVEALEP